MTQRHGPLDASPDAASRSVLGGTLVRGGGAISRTRAFTAVVLGTACHVSAHSTLERIEPPRGLNDRENAVALLGSGLDPELHERGDEVVAARWEAFVGDRPLRSVRWKNRERIEAVVPIGVPPGTHDVILRMGETEFRIAGAYTAVVPRAPRLDEAAPSSIPSGGGPVRLIGSGFHLGSAVFVRGTLAPTEWVDDGTLVVAAPPGPLGPASLEVKTPVGEAWRDDLLIYRADGPSP